MFKGYNIKGGLFHQGYNNAMMQACRPQRYRALMKLMVEGWRDDFKDPKLPVGVIGFCAGGNTQNEDNFEAESFAGAPFIREAQRLGLADVRDPVNTAFLPAYDVQVQACIPRRNAITASGRHATAFALRKVQILLGIDFQVELFKPFLIHEKIRQSAVEHVEIDISHLHTQYLRFVSLLRIFQDSSNEPTAEDWDWYSYFSSGSSSAACRVKIEVSLKVRRDARGGITLNDRGLSNPDLRAKRRLCGSPLVPRRIATALDDSP